MNANLDLMELSDGLGHMVTIDGTRPLAELTELVNAICHRVDSRAEKSVVVLRVDASATGQRQWPGEVSIHEVNRWEQAVHRLERLSAAIIAVASGLSGGPALDLLLASDFRIGTPDMLLVLPVNDGLMWPGTAIYRLVQQIGLARARQIVLWGTDISVERATELGLVDQVASDISDAVQTATVLMGRISDRELAIRRQLLVEAGSARYEDALGTHLAACDRELRRLGRGSDS